MENKIKIAHEVPLALLDQSLKFNDYQYVLPHLIDKYSQYREFILNYRNSRDSFIIMDNGLFEGVEHTEEDLISKIELVKPDIFILPDVWNDSYKTAENANYWIDNYMDMLYSYDVNPMIVLQGETYGELFNLFYKCYENGFRFFAINHSSLAYINNFANRNKAVSQMMGRIKFIHIIDEYMKTMNIDDVYIHLLGSSLPQEFIYYKDYDLIKSIDSSNPIVVGLLGKRYEEYGLLYKPENKIETFMELDITNEYKNIKYNIYKFRSWSKYETIPEQIIGN